MYYGGLDIGTTGCKVNIYNEEGVFIHNAYCEYQSTRNASVQEIDPESVFAGVCTVLNRAVDAVGEIASIAVTSFGESFVLLDQNDQVLLPSMLYTDKRGNEEAKSFDADAVMHITGVRPQGMYSIPKLMWIKSHLPQIYERADKILLFQDYIVYMLTGVRQIDYSLAARTMGFDIKGRCWSKEIFDAAGIDMNKMSLPVCAGSVAGKATLPKLCNTVIVNGCHDQVAAVLGGGIFESGMAIDCTGTVACTTPVFDTIPQDPRFYDAGYCVIPHIFDGKYLCYAVSFAGGAALKWYKDAFLKEYSYRELDASVSSMPSGLLILPHFAGAGTPYMDASAEAVFSGITLGTTPMDLYRAVMEGVAYEMRLNIERLSDYGIAIERLYAAGGGAKSGVWLQIKADILGREIVALEDVEAGAVGGAMLAAVGAGLSMEAAQRLFVKQAKAYFPDPVRHQAYNALYEKYRKMYNASKAWR